MQIKLEIDNGYDKQGKATEYSLSKFYIAKLSHPCTTKAPAKHTNWFVSLFNYLQAQTLEKSTVADNSSSDDEFSSYLKNSLVRGVSSIHCLNVFSNKMNANDCLTALKFTAYLQHLKLQPHSSKLNLSEMSQLKITLENELGKSCKEEKVWTKQVCTWLPTEESTFWLDISTIVAMHNNIMQTSNMLEY